MAVRENRWNVVVEGAPYQVVLNGNRVIVNNEEPMKLSKLSQSGNAWVETHYSIPLGGKEVILHIKMLGKPVLTYEGRDCNTNEVYEPLKMPGWMWVFIVLHALNFFLLIGGAIGGAIQALVIGSMIAISSNQKKSTAVRVVTCAGIWLASTIVQIILAFILVSLFPNT